MGVTPRQGIGQTHQEPQLAPVGGVPRLGGLTGGRQSAVGDEVVEGVGAGGRGDRRRGRVAVDPPAPEVGAADALSKKIYASYLQFRASIMDWSDIAEGSILGSRRLG